MRLNDVGLRRRQTKLIYPNQRSPPWLAEDAAPRSLQPIVRQPHALTFLRAMTLARIPAYTADWARGNLRFEQSNISTYETYRTAQDATAQCESTVN